MRHPFLASLAICCLILTSSTRALSQWHTIAHYPSDPNNFFQNASFISGKEGYLAFLGYLAYTQDSGRTLTQRPVNVPEFPSFLLGFNGVKAVDANTVFAYGQEDLTPVILKSTDKGVTWRTVYQYPITNPSFVGRGVTQLAQIDPAHYIALEKGLIITSNDGGNTWAPSNSGAVPAEFTALAVRDFGDVYAIADGQLFRINNTLTSAVTSFSGQAAQNVAVTPSGRIYVEGDNGHIYSSADNAASWQDQTPPGLYWSHIDAWRWSDDNTGIAIMSGQFYRTINHGAIWERMLTDADMSNSDNMVTDLSAVNDQLIFAGGLARLLYATDNGGGTPIPKAWFNVDTSRITHDSIINLVNYSTTGYTYAWYRNDTLISNAYNVSYPTLRSRRDTIRLIVTNAAGSDTLIKTIETRVPNPICNADFTITQDTSTVKLHLKGYDIDYRQHTWYMGDQAVLTDHEPTYQFKQKGYFIIRHVVSDPLSGCNSYVELPVNITQLTRCDGKITALHHTIDSIVNDSVTFAINYTPDYTTTVPDSAVHWHYGDGDTAQGNALGRSWTHDYRNSGTFYPSIRLLYNNGICDMTVTDTVVIAMPDCSAKFHAVAGQSATMVAQPTNNPGAKIHTWIFDDNVSATVRGDIHFWHSYQFMVNYWPYTCEPSPYGWYGVMNMDSTLRKIKHIVTDTVTGCTLADSLIVDQGFKPNGMFGFNTEYIVYQNYNNPYSFNFQVSLTQYTPTWQCLTIEGMPSSSNKNGYWKINFPKNGTYYGDGLDNTYFYYIWRKKIVVDGEQRYFFSQPNNEIIGRVFVDNDGNNIQDPGEPLFTLPAKITGTAAGKTTTVYNERGNFRFTLPSGDVTTTLSLDKPYYTIAPAQKISAFGANVGRSDTVVFALRPISGVQDGAVRLLQYTAARPGFNAGYVLQVANPGINPITNPHIVVHKDSRTTGITASPAPTVVTTDSITWDLPTIPPGSTVSIQLNTTLAPPPVINIGDTLNWLATIAVPGDVDTTDNSFRLKQLVTGSLDPNNKSENFGGLIRKTQVDSGQWIYYLVRMQNTGTDTAFNIILRDTLDSRLDASTFQMLEASHPYKLTVANGNQLGWIFKQIQLPDSNRNEPGSHAYVLYRIKALTNLLAGDSIVNAASIYFDFNPPVPTNRQVTVVDHKPLPLPAPKPAGLAAAYCSTDAADVFRIANQPAATTATVQLDGSTLAPGADSSYTFHPATLTAGDHRLSLVFTNNRQQRSETDTTFNILAPKHPVIQLLATPSTVQHATDSITFKAMVLADSGANPVYTFSLDRRFTTTLNAQGNTLHLAASSLQEGKNTIFVKMTASYDCPAVAIATDSVIVTRTGDATTVVTPPPPTSTSGIRIYPNPFNSRIDLSGLDPNRSYHVILATLMGQKCIDRVFTGQTTLSLSTGQLAKGMYWLTVFDTNQQRISGPTMMIRL